MRARLHRLRDRRDLWALGTLLGAGIGLRVWLTSAWRPAMLGYSDTGGYLEVAGGGSLFANPYQPGGYPLFLRAAHAVSARIEVVPLLQHTLGVASALLLWAAVRRLGAPGWAALLPAGVTLLFGTGLLAEHAVITESLFTFLQAVAFYAWARIAAGGRAWWAVLVGLAIAASATVRVVGLAFVPLLALAVALAPSAPWWSRLVRVGLAGVAALVVLGGYAAANHEATGHFGLTRAGSWNLYGRVARFADCREFTPPAGTEALCESIPAGERPGPNDYVHRYAASPALRTFGYPLVARQDDNDRVAAFARAAILGTPRAYVAEVLDDLGRLWEPEHGGGPGDGLSYEGLVGDYLLAETGRPLQPYWEDEAYDVRGDGGIAAYERATRIKGPLLVLLVLLAVAGPLLARGRERLVAAVPVLLGLGGLVIPTAAYMYDARFMLPAFGVIAAAAALGATAVARRLRPSARIPSGA